MSSCALIFGISGQDGGLLAQQLLADGYKVAGVSRDAERNTFRNLVRLGIRGKVDIHSANMADFPSVLRVIEAVEPDEIFNVSGQSSVALSFDQPLETIESILVATINVLESMRILKAPIRCLNAASSECFGDTGPAGADEDTPFRPRSPYGIAKAAAFWAVRTYRESYGLRACSAILFNHESPLRPEPFVTQKIISAASGIARGETAERLLLGNLSIARDWGWAEEYVEAMRAMNRLENSEDLVVATGVCSTLGDFVREAFAAFGLESRQHVRSVDDLMRPSEIMVSVGRPERARQKLGWVARTRMPEVVRKLAEAVKAQEA